MNFIWKSIIYLDLRTHGYDEKDYTKQELIKLHNGEWIHIYIFCNDDKSNTFYKTDVLYIIFILPSWLLSFDYYRAHSLTPSEKSLI